MDDGDDKMYVIHDIRNIYILYVYWYLL